MAKLTRQQRKAHAEAEAILKKDRLSDDEVQFVFENWHEGAEFNTGSSGAFFTPNGLAADFSLEVGSGKIIDLCAGIGALAYYAFHGCRYSNHSVDITCIERNPRYAEVGKKLLPHARWIVAHVLDWQDWWRDELQGQKFDWAIGNPPFGKVRRSGDAPRYKGGEFEYHVIDIAGEMADNGVFIIPQQSATFSFSGSQMFVENEKGKGAKFCKKTGWNMQPGLGIDCGIYVNKWKDTKVMTEVVNFDFDEDRKARKLELKTTNSAPARQAEQLAFF